LRITRHLRLGSPDPERGRGWDRGKAQAADLPVKQLAYRVADIALAKRTTHSTTESSSQSVRARRTARRFPDVSPSATTLAAAAVESGETRAQRQLQASSFMKPTISTSRCRRLGPQRNQSIQFVKSIILSSVVADWFRALSVASRLGPDLALRSARHAGETSLRRRYVFLRPSTGSGRGERVERGCLSDCRRRHARDSRRARSRPELLDCGCGFETSRRCPACSRSLQACSLEPGAEGPVSPTVSATARRPSRRVARSNATSEGPCSVTS